MVSAGTIALLVFLLKSSSVDFKQVGYNVKVVSKAVVKVPKKVVKVVKKHVQGS